MLAPRTTNLRSQRDINMWRNPAAALARRGRAIRNHVASGRSRQIGRCSHPVVVDDGRHRRRAGDPVGNDGRGRDRARADFLDCIACAVDGLDAVWPAPTLSVPAGLGYSEHDRHVHGHVRVHLPRLSRHASGSDRCR